MENGRCGIHAGCLHGITLAREYLSTSKTVRPEHQMPFARSLRHGLRVFCRPHNALQVAPAGGPHNEALVTNLETATKLLRIILALLQSSDGRCSRQERYNENTQQEKWRASLAGWWYSREDVDKKQGKITPKARRIQAIKLAHERGGITKAAGALISPPTALQGNRTLSSKRF